MNTSDTLKLPIGADAMPRTRAAILTMNCFRILAAATIILLIYRIALMWWLPLADTTEARYGEIARMTVTHGFWLMPHIDINTPFWAKPPMSTWLAAGSMSLFGINEFAARLPSLLASLVAAYVGMQFAAAFSIKRTWLVLPIFATSPLFFISAGAVMTDAIQMCIVVCAHYFAWRAIAAFDAKERHSIQRWQLLFWITVGIGALSKGLADWALIGLPLLVYAAIERRPMQIFKALFNWKGVLLSMCIFLPWYIAAEISNPGFLNYFIVGEHFSIFLVPGWKGDRYGIAHLQPLGMIWAFWIVSILPWIVVFVLAGKDFLSRIPSAQPLERFLWSATIAPLLFFTFAHNIIWTYGLTAIVPFAVLVVRRLEAASERNLQITAYGILVLTVASVLAAPLVISNVSGNSDRQLVRVFHQTAPAGTSLIYTVKPTYSSNFYARSDLAYAPENSAPSDSENHGVRYAVVSNGDIEVHQNAKVLFSGTRRSLIEEP
jgi:4-amino-4-deoxy-L-arabinose transferase-like glycosyltransferase